MVATPPSLQVVLSIAIILVLTWRHRYNIDHKMSYYHRLQLLSRIKKTSAWGCAVTSNNMDTLPSPNCGRNVENATDIEGLRSITNAKQGMAKMWAVNSTCEQWAVRKNIYFWNFFQCSLLWNLWLWYIVVISIIFVMHFLRTFLQGMYIDISLTFHWLKMWCWKETIQNIKFRINTIYMDFFIINGFRSGFFGNFFHLLIPCWSMEL
jgi:hypothetical protein